VGNHPTIVCEAGPRTGWWGFGLLRRTTMICILLAGFLAAGAALDPSASSANRWADGTGTSSWSDNALLYVSTPPWTSNMVEAAQLIIRDYSASVGGPWSYLTVDGVYDQYDLVAVQWYQQQHGLNPDGYIGANTWTAMRNDLTWFYNGSGFTSYRTPANLHEFRVETTGSTRWYFYLNGPNKWYWCNLHLEGPKPSGSYVTGDGDEKTEQINYTFDQAYAQSWLDWQWAGLITTTNRRVYGFHYRQNRRWISGTWNSLWVRDGDVEAIRVKMWNNNGSDAHYYGTNTDYFYLSSSLYGMTSITAYVPWFLSGNNSDGKFIQTTSSSSGGDGTDAQMIIFVDLPTRFAEIHYLPGWSGWERYWYWL